jgi:putative ABC transport system permease protein
MQAQFSQWAARGGRRASANPIMSELLRDIRYGLRLLRKSPGFTAVALAALALGIGANSAIFSVVNSVLLRPLPYRDSGRIGVVFEASPAQGWSQIGISGPDYADLREQAKSLDDLALIENGTGTVLGFGEPRQAPGLRVTTNVFRMLGKKPMLGRDFTPAEGFENRVAILSYNGWHKLYGDDTSVIGRRVIVDDIPYTIVGVMPADFWLPLPADLFAPWSVEDLRRRSRMNKSFTVLGRVRQGISYGQASAELNTIVHRIAHAEPHMKDWSASITPMQEVMVENVRPALLVLLGAVGLVLLIACTNLANLMLARAAARGRETAIRTALGATRRVLMRQFFAETMLLGVFGGAIGLLLAMWGVDLLNRIVPATISVGQGTATVVRPDLVVDGTVLAFTVALSLLTGLLFGLVPAISASRTDVNEALKEGGRNTSSGRGHRMRNVLVISEVALALVLLVSAGLTLKSFWKLQQVNPGFLADHVLTMEMELPTDAKYQKDGEQVEFFRRVLANVDQVPGVVSAGITCALPLGEDDRKTDFRIEGRPLPSSGQLLPADYRVVSGGFFRAMGIPLLRGRSIAESDAHDRPLVAVIDRALERRYWPDGVEDARDPIGQRLVIHGREWEIVGVVGEVNGGGLNRVPLPTIYMSYRQAVEPRMALVVRHPQAEGMINAIKQAVYDVDKDQPVYNVRTMDEIVDGSQSSSRFTLLLLGIFAATALTLAAVGIYGVISYSVTQRTSEIGIRMALGAGRESVLRLVVGDGMALAGIGIAIGLVGGLGAGRLLGSILYGVSASDPFVFGLTAIVLALVALCAASIPAVRAARIDPGVSLRYQ